jgi:CHAD domain-containing protein
MIDHEPDDQGRSRLTPESRPRIKPRDQAKSAVLSALCGALSRIAASDLAARTGDGEGIHRLRTSTRRLRSELHAFRDLVDPQWREPLERELKWLAGMLGGVRDLDVLAARLQKAASFLDENDTGELLPIFRSLQERHGAAAAELQNAMRSERYHALQVMLQQAIERPVLLDAAWEPCRTALPPLAIAAWRKLKMGARELRPSDPDEKFHEVRKRAKRARYTAELIAPVLHRRSKRSLARFIRLTTQVQNTLGEHQDAVIASQAIERQIAEDTDDPGFVEAAGRLLDNQKNAVETARDKFFTVWDKLDRKKSRRWMKIETVAKAKSRA